MFLVRGLSVMWIICIIGLVFFGMVVLLVGVFFLFVMNEVFSGGLLDGLFSSGLLFLKWLYKIFFELCCGVCICMRECFFIRMLDRDVLLRGR